VEDLGDLVTCGDVMQTEGRHTKGSDDTLSCHDCLRTRCQSIHKETSILFIVHDAIASFLGHVAWERGQ